MLERAVSEYPKEPQSHLYLAIVLDQQGETARAEKHFAHAIALNPRNATVFYNWGAFLHRQGRLQEALRAYETAYQLDPTMVGALQSATALRQALGVGGAPAPPIPSFPQALHTRSGSPWVSLGLFSAVLGLCAPTLGLSLGLLFGILAILQGAWRRGLVVIVLAIVLSSIGACGGRLVEIAGQGTMPS